MTWAMPWVLGDRGTVKAGAEKYFHVINTKKNMQEKAANGE